MSLLPNVEDVYLELWDKRIEELYRGKESDEKVDRLKNYPRTQIAQNLYIDYLEAMREFGRQVRDITLEWAASNALTKEEEVYNGGLDPEKLSMYDKIQVIDTESILSGKTHPDLEIK